MAIYNLSTIDSATNPYTIAAATNQLGIPYLMFNLILLAIFIITILSMKAAGNDLKTIFLTASATTTLIGIIMFFLKLIPETSVILPILTLFISIFIYKFGE